MQKFIVATLLIAAAQTAGADEAYDVGNVHLIVMRQHSDVQGHPSTSISVPAGFRVIGGGANVNWAGEGNLLTGVYPSSTTSFMASSKDHILASPASIDAYVIAARMKDGSPISDDDYILVQKDSSPGAYPEAAATVPTGFQLVGGGARVNWTEPGNMLTASFPQGNSWIARSKDHARSSVATLSVFAIGLKQSFLDANGLRIQQRSQRSDGYQQHPTATCALDFGFRLLSGGAEAQWSGAGQLLTATYPVDVHQWRASSKDHWIVDYGSVTAYCIGISF